MKKILKNKIYNKKVQKKPYFSIVLPYYNTRSEFLFPCLESILKQDYKDFETIIVDNSDNEFSHKILKNFKDVDKFKVFIKEKCGVSKARNIGIKKAVGEYVVFVDADDYLPHNALSIFSQIIRQNSNPQIVIGKCLLKRDELKENYSYYADGFVINKNELIDSLFKNYKNKYSCIDTPWAKAFRRKFLVDNKIEFNKTLSNGEDGVFNYEALVKAESIYFTNQIVYIYRFNQYSVCASFSKNLDLQFARLYNVFQQKIIQLETFHDLEKLYFLATRNVCRLFRKLYSKCSSYKEFKNKLTALLKEMEYKIPLKMIKLKNLNFSKKLVVLLIRFRIFLPLYILSKKGVFNKIK